MSWVISTRLKFLAYKFHSNSTVMKAKVAHLCIFKTQYIRNCRSDLEKRILIELLRIEVKSTPHTPLELLVGCCYVPSNIGIITHIAMEFFKLSLEKLDTSAEKNIAILGDFNAQPLGLHSRLMVLSRTPRRWCYTCPTGLAHSTHLQVVILDNDRSLT